MQETVKEFSGGHAKTEKPVNRKRGSSASGKSVRVEEIEVAHAEEVMTMRC